MAESVPSRDSEEESRIAKREYETELLSISRETKILLEKVKRITGPITDEADKEQLKGTLKDLLCRFAKIDKNCADWYYQTAMREGGRLDFNEGLRKLTEMFAIPQEKLIEEVQRKKEAVINANRIVVQHVLEEDGQVLSRDLKEESKLGQEIYEKDVLILDEMAKDYLKKRGELMGKMGTMNAEEKEKGISSLRVLLNHMSIRLGAISEEYSGFIIDIKIKASFPPRYVINIGEIEEKVFKILTVLVRDVKRKQVQQQQGEVVGN